MHNLKASGLRRRLSPLFDRLKRQEGNSCRLFYKLRDSLWGG